MMERDRERSCSILVCRSGEKRQSLPTSVPTATTGDALVRAVAPAAGALLKRLSARNVVTMPGESMVAAFQIVASMVPPLSVYSTGQFVQLLP